MFLCLFLLTVAATAGQAPTGTFYSAIEKDGVICGYAKSDLSRGLVDGRQAITAVAYIEFKVSALGADIETIIKTTSHIDEKTGDYFFTQFDIDQKTIQFGITITIDGDTAVYSSRPGDKVKKIALPSDILLENSEFMPRLIKDFMEDGLTEKNYKVLDGMDAAIHEITCTKMGVEELELAGTKYNALHIKRLDLNSGLKTENYLNIENGVILKTVLPGRTVYLADESVIAKVERVSVDDNLMAKTEVNISDVKGLSYLKVEAMLEPGGLWITEEGLNIPGQKFSGTVTDNLIEGVFEVSHVRYDGSGAPPFPADYSDNEDMRPYLASEELIEADDPVLVAKAQAITAGATDSWDAFRRLSQWVAEEIGYEIPGGGGARNTYDLGVGECGAHSRLLAAFSRAVGIPCRVVWGCMYVPDFGGGFGQHGWNEVYMGDAGWIPVDATAKEIDYVDSGHLRIGALASKTAFLNPKKMKILDYRAGDVTMSTAGPGESPDDYSRYIGEYQGPGKVFKILFQNQSLAVDIPGRPVVFELREPDAEGRWVFKLTDDAAIKFQENDAGEITEMTLISINRMPRNKSAEATAVVIDTTGVPAEYHPYLGKYLVPLQNMDLTVIFEEGNLAVDDPQAGKIVHTTGPDENMLWTDEFNQNQLSFTRNESGQVTALVIHQNIRMPKI
jgi:transglutaminase-like putative cysteine protease